MMKQIGIILVVLLLAGLVFAAPAGPNLKQYHAIVMYGKPAPVSGGSSISTGSSGGPVSTWYFWHMMKMNREKSFVPTAPRGRYDFEKKEWVKP